MLANTKQFLLLLDDPKSKATDQLISQVNDSKQHIYLTIGLFSQDKQPVENMPSIQSTELSFYCLSTNYRPGELRSLIRSIECSTIPSKSNS
jgi:hypothetical protein